MIYGRCVRWIGVAALALVLTACAGARSGPYTIPPLTDKQKCRSSSSEWQMNQPQICEKLRLAQERIAACGRLLSDPGQLSEDEQAAYLAVRGANYQSISSYRSAIEDYSAFISLYKPEHDIFRGSVIGNNIGEAYMARGLSYLAVAEVDKAIADKERALEIRPHEDSVQQMARRFDEQLSKPRSLTEDQAALAMGTLQRLCDERRLPEPEPGSPESEILAPEARPQPDSLPADTL